MSLEIFNRPLSLSVDHASPREILNRLVAVNGDLRWIVRYQGTSAADAVEAHCFIGFETFPGVGLGIAKTLPPLHYTIGGVAGRRRP